MVPLYKRYKEEIILAMKEKFGISNTHVLPQLKKVCCNVGVGFDNLSDKKVLDYVKNDLALITGQLPVITKARKSISNFKIRKGFPIGCKVTLRRRMMFNFVDKLVNIVMPRIRDFRGISAKSFDGNGNFSMGLTEHVLFPEIDIGKVNFNFGMDITFVIENGNSERSFEMLKMLGVPFANDGE